jgi:light-regulated signal transduction histidine kinase (bacteriophytochrome)
MGQLIDGLLAFSRLGRQNVTKQLVSPGRLIGPLVEQLRCEADPARNIEVTVQPLPLCRADPLLLRQVFLNLLSNAFKFTRSREPAMIEVGSLLGETSNEVIYYVKDNGVGFDMRYVSKLFGVFQRLHRAEEFEGTGVGLAIVHRIVQRHGGRVWAKSEPGQGATFYVALEGAAAATRVD